MDADLAYRLAALGEAQHVLLSELNSLGDGAQASLETLQRLRESVAALAEQADGLMALMLEQDADDDLLDLGDAFVEFAQSAEVKILQMLRAHKGG